QNPERVEVSVRSSTATTVTQRLVATHGKDYEKRATLRDLIRAQEELKNAIIFCNRKVDVADLFRSLDRHGFSVGALHGDMDQRSRTTMLANFKENKLTLLVASDVAARGLDIPDVSHVFNFDVPIHAEDYVHRIGRTGRAGRSGAAFTLVSKRDGKFVDAIEKLIDQKIEWLSGGVEDLPQAAESEERERPRSGRDRGGRDRDRDRSRGRSKGEARVTETRIETVETEEKVEVVKAERKAEGRPQTPARNPRAANHAAPRPANDDSRDRRNRYRRDDDDGPTPLGFGDEVPAFMLVAGKA
ncbi:MAG: helicase-related protein, partial [Shinella sp.]